MTALQPPLPGMDPPAPDRTAMERAADVVIRKLQEEDVLEPQHAITVQLVYDLSRAIGLAARKGQAAGMAMASRELRETMELLPKVGQEAFQQLLQQMRENDDQGATK